MDAGGRGGMIWFMVGLLAGGALELLFSSWKRAIKRRTRSKAICDMYPIYLDRKAPPDVEHAIRCMDAMDYTQDAGLILTLERTHTN
jgi:hypothetical protein